MNEACGIVLLINERLECKLKYSDRINELIFLLVKNERNVQNKVPNLILSLTWCVPKRT
jgi:hypothetical protein